MSAAALARRPPRPTRAAVWVAVLATSLAGPARAQGIAGGEATFGQGGAAVVRDGALAVGGISRGAVRFTASDPGAWLLHRPGRLDVLERFPGPDTYEPPHRSPRRFALLDGVTFGDFDLTVEAAQTSHEYGHRDLCVVFGFTGPARFHYVHFATTPDENACNVFVVDGAPRRRLAEIPARGVEWGPAEGQRAESGAPLEAAWHTLRVQREGGVVRAWFDQELVVEATDARNDVGLVGFGTFDDSGRFRRLAVTGTLGAAAASPFAPVPTAPSATADWPQGAGPRGDWSTTGTRPPTHISARRNENLIWRTPLPAAGQGGIAASGGRLYLATMAPYDPAAPLPFEDAERYRHATEGRAVVGKHIDAHAFDAATGALLWTRRVEGEVPSIHAYPFSDATSASPVTDGSHVWFTNAGGRVVCFTKDGELVWQREFLPTFDGPFNKQFEPFLVRDGRRQVFVHMEPFPAPGADPAGVSGRWNHLVGLDAATGEVLWRSADGLTHYNAPTLVATDDGMCALIGRGGPHDVPERPVGMSLVRLTGARAGTSVWRYDDPRGNHEAALHVMAHDGRYAYWVLRDPRSALVVVDLATGRELREISLTRDVVQTTYDAESGRWRSEWGVDLNRGVFPARYSVAAYEGRVHFQCYHTAFGQPTLAPAYSFGRVDVALDLVEYLEVPTDFERDAAGDPSFLWRTPRESRALDHRGVEVTGDERSRWDGWDWVFNAAPLRIHSLLYYTLPSGVVYVLNARAEFFDGWGALVAVSDVGVAGETWAAATPTFVNGRLLYRTSNALLCFGHPAQRK